MRTVLIVASCLVMALGWLVTRAQAGDSPTALSFSGPAPVLGPVLLIAGFTGLSAALYMT